MNLRIAVNIARDIHNDFGTDAGASKYFCTSTTEQQIEARRFLEAHPARLAGRPSIRRSISDAILIFKTVERLQAPHGKH